MKNFSLLLNLYFQTCFYLFVDAAWYTSPQLDIRHNTNNKNGFVPLLTRSLKEKECINVVYTLGFDSEFVNASRSDPSTLSRISNALEATLMEEIKEIKNDWEIEPNINVDHVHVRDQTCPETFINSISCVKFDTQINIEFEMSRDELEIVVENSLRSSMENGDFVSRTGDDYLKEVQFHRVTECGEEGFTSDHIVVLSTLAIMVMTLVLLFISKRRKRDDGSQEVPQEDKEEEEDVQPEPIKVDFRNRVSVIVPEGEAKNYEELKTERVVNKFRGSVMPKNVADIDIEDDDEGEEKREVDGTLDDHHMDLEVVNVQVQEEFLPTSSESSTKSLLTGTVAYNV